MKDKNHYAELVQIVGAYDAVRIVSHLTRKIQEASIKPHFPDPITHGNRFSGYPTLKTICHYSNLDFAESGACCDGWSLIFACLEPIAKKQIEALASGDPED